MQRGWKAAALALAATMVLAGSASAQRGRGFGMRGSGTNLLRMPEVQTELKLSDEQKSKLTPLLEQLQEQRRSQFQDLRDLSDEERTKRMAEWRANETKQLNTVLNADQQKRFRQLQLQQQGMSAVAEKEVADELKLTAEQRTKIQEISQAQAAEMRSLFQGGGGGGDREAMQQKMAAMRKQTDEKIAAVLTEDQKRQWQAMLGAPFTFPTGRQAV